MHNDDHQEPEGVKPDGLEPPAAEDLSKERPMEGVWSDGRSPRQVCSARKTNGEPCRKAAIEGARVCRTHGGAAPQVKQAARVRLEMAAKQMVDELVKMALNDDVPPAVKLAAMKDVLDRGGLSAKTAVEVEVNLKPWEQIFEKISRDTGEDDDGAYERLLAAASTNDPEVEYAEVVDVAYPDATRPQEPHPYPPDAHTAEPAGWPGVPGVPGTPRALAAGASDAVTGDAAVARAAEHNRRGANLPVRYEGPAAYSPRGKR